VNRRELLESARGLAAALVAATSLPVLFTWWRTSRAKDRAPKAWADLGAASKVESALWQRRTLTLERVNRWRRDVQEEVVYLRRKGDAVESVSAICPHTGCLVKPRAEGFECPCHKSRFDPEGASIDGPSPRALDRLECKVERGRLPAQARTQEAQINEQHGTQCQTEADQMGGFDQREYPGRLAYRLAERCIVAPLEEREEVHQYTDAVGSQLVRKLMSQGCGCRSQSNQL
jgi:Rieske Fe-S protein